MHWTERAGRRAAFGATFRGLLLLGLALPGMGFAGWAARAQAPRQAPNQLPAQGNDQPPPPATLPVSPAPHIPMGAGLPGETGQVEPRFTVVIDAAHGGADQGARISERILEKDLVLSLSVRLRSLLAARGISVITTRESDNELTAQARAEAVNHVSAAACILLHATGTGSGVHLYTSSLSQTGSQTPSGQAGSQAWPGQAGPGGARFLPWQTAQSAYITQSLRLSSEINSAYTHDSIPIVLGRTSLQPMDSLECPAVAVEVAPLPASGGRPALGLGDPGYQRRLIDALAGAITEWRNDWRQQP